MLLKHIKTNRFFWQATLVTTFYYGEGPPIKLSLAFKWTLKKAVKQLLSNSPIENLVFLIS